jgi:hypothetical protein
MLVTHLSYSQAIARLGDAVLRETAMSKDDDILFYEDRARHEADAATRSDKPGLAAAHRLLAIEYASHAESLRSETDLKQQQSAGNQLFSGITPRRI